MLRLLETLRVVAINPMHPRPDRLRGAIETLKRGGVVALPTETFYGLAADALNARAVARVNRIKGKPVDSPVLLLLADPNQVETVASRIPELFHRLAETFWPGPLTLVVPAAAELPRAVSGARGTVAVRVPGLGLPRQVARELGRPISGVSANRHGQPPLRTAVEVAKIFGGALEMILDGGATTGGAPSTILDLSGARPRLVREGVLPASALRAFLPDVEGVD